MRIGRTYTLRSNSKVSDEQRRCIWNVVLTLFTIGATCFLWVTERDKAAFALSANEIRESVVEAPQGVEPSNVKSLIHVSSVASNRIEYSPIPTLVSVFPEPGQYIAKWSTASGQKLLSRIRSSTMTELKR